MSRTRRFFFALLAGAVLCLASSTAARADTVVFQTNFNTTPGGLYDGTFTPVQLTNSGFAVTGNSVNSLNNGFLDNFCVAAGGAPGCIGMNTDGAGGQIATNMMFAPGTYTVSFDLAGEPLGFGGETDNIAVILGDVLNESISLDAGAPFRTITLTATVTPFSQLTTELVFSAALRSGNNTVGLLLDNVTVTLLDGATPPPPPTEPIPEPATMLLLGTGLAGVVAKVRRRRKE